MIVFARIVDGPLTDRVQADALAAEPHEPASPEQDGRVGATLRFAGIVRRFEPCAEHRGEPRRLLALDYQTYDPMAQRQLELLARDVGERHGLLSVIVLHSRGRVRVGEVSFLLEMSGSHRAETLAGMTEFIDRLKQDVPIWKQPVWDAEQTPG